MSYSPPPDLSIVHPFPTPPGAGDLIEVAPGIWWVRLPLPFRLDHVNVYLLEDGDGFALVDCGIDDKPTRAIWERLLASRLRERPIRRMIVTHHHPDHVGTAAWLGERCGVPLEMSETEYLLALALIHDPAALEGQPFRRFYTDNGLSSELTDEVVTQGHRYLRMISGLPPTFRRIVAGETLTIGARRFEVLTGGGHAAEQVMLYSRADNILISADQVLARISPNVSVHPRDPDGDPLGIYLCSLASVAAAVSADALVLPGHDLPFVGLHARTEGLCAHHESRCNDVAGACRAQPLSAAELIPVLFRRELDPHGTGFAFSEAMAHVNYMLRAGRLTRHRGRDGIERFSTVV